jgi:hypothetical protein
VTVAARCVTCGGEFTEEQIQGATACPTCGDKGVPVDPANDVELRINWHELRLLTIWSDNWARENCDEGARRAHAAILRRLRAQHPEKSGLTILDDAQELADGLGTNVEVHGPEGRKVIKPEKKN